MANQIYQQAIVILNLIQDPFSLANIENGFSLIPKQVWDDAVFVSGAMEFL